jgi:hypothetical protein
MIANVKFRSIEQPHMGADKKTRIKTKEVKCDQIDIEGNVIKFVKDMGVGSYKSVFILNIDHLIQVDTELTDE